MNAAKYRDILEENLFQGAQDLRLGRRFTFQQDNDPKHTAKITKEWLWNNSVTILDWPSQSPDLNPIEHLWRDLKMAVHQHSPSNLTELERIKEEWQRIPKSSSNLFFCMFGMSDELGEAGLFIDYTAPLCGCRDVRQQPIQETFYHVALPEAWYVTSVCSF
ncbi:hypothetical protein L3Q82_000420 [Scortum barcoo]|uniref:Uncharacterized protein n=1 Tax=Scortum barcoo TaxID=214431 RepID=A0ACB8XAE8_9TELE|nr:hypothetical protein L3Q82_000420 [Scortum barcoo]